MFISTMCAPNQLNGQLEAEVNLLRGKMPAVPFYMRLGGPRKQFETNIWPHRRESNGDTHPVRNVVTIPTEISLSLTESVMSRLPQNKFPSYMWK